MSRLPNDYPERFVLANEVHARPYEAIETPLRASYFAILVDAAERDLERRMLAELCVRFGLPVPADDANHYSENFGGFRLKWERHGEFSTFTVLAPGQGAKLFADPAIEWLPAEWLAALPGKTVAAAHAELLPAESMDATAAGVAPHFSAESLVGAGIGDGAGFAFTDFKICADGCVRFLMLDRSFGRRQAGRMLQRLFEIEAYRVMALLGYSTARSISPRVLELERSLAALIDALARGDRADESLLDELTPLAALVESTIAMSAFRFGASRAYYDLVRSRIADLREQRLPGLQTIEEFMARRLAPAMATRESVAQRLAELSGRVDRASGLLSTRVDIAREQQNQALLSSMDRRARQQLRLQQTVEGLSVVAMTYYAVGLIGYAARALRSAGVPVAPDVAMGIAIPVVAVLVALGVRRIRRRIVGEV